MSVFGVTTAPPDSRREKEIPYGPPASSPDTDDRERGSGGDEPVPEEGDERSALVFRVPRLRRPTRKIVAAALFGVGLLIVFFVIYLFAFTPLTASRNQQRLAQTFESQPLKVYSLVGGARPLEGEPVAVITIPAINLSQIVVEGTSAADLMNGPGLLPGTAVPGAPGNSVIAARRVTFGGPFGPLGSLRSGDRIKVVDGAGTFTYLVKSVRVVTAGQHDVVAQTSANLLTLITSNGGLIPNGRLAVQAKLKGPPVSVQTKVVVAPHSELGLGGDDAAAGLAVLWSLGTVLVLIGAALAVWRWRRPALIYVFAAPVVVACGLMACENLARSLPATF